MRSVVLKTKKLIDMPGRQALLNSMSERVYRNVFAGIKLRYRIRQQRFSDTSSSIFLRNSQPTNSIVLL